MKKFFLFKKIKPFTNAKKSSILTKVVFWVFGISSTIWFLLRVIPKPSRATYPCMRTTAPVMSGFVVYLLSLSGSAIMLKWFHKKISTSKYLVSSALFIAAFVMIITANGTSKSEDEPITLLEPEHFIANSPIGTATGYKPGRVVWVWNKNATNEKFTPSNNQNNWWAKHTNGAEVEKMLQEALEKYADKKTTAEAWDALFKYFNEQHGKGVVGYSHGEKIYIKINITNSANGMRKTQNFDRMDATPELALVLLKQLIEVVGVEQSDIFIGDPFRNFHNLYWDMCHAVYPNVIYCDGLGVEGRHQTIPTSEHVLVFSDKNLDYRIPQEYVDADYFINMPCLKTHDQGGITLGAKNHQGSALQDGGRSDNQYLYTMHYSLPANSPGYKKYRHLVDYMGHKDLGGNTLLTIIDGIWAGLSWEGYVEKWAMAPFNNDYPSSLFISQDKVAIDAVCYDFLLEEYKDRPDEKKYPYYDGCDDYLLQAADPSYWPDDIVYDPEGDGTPLASMGVYEHWNNPEEMKYSRNLATGEGIELIKVNQNTDPFTPENSGLISPKVNKIFIDSFNVKWFGTDKGISRFDGENWTLIDTSNHLKENTINDILYEKTRYGDEIWVATNGGLSVMSFNVDGVTSATTYYVGGSESGIISDTVTAVGLDKNHNRWIATPKGINVFGSNGWDTNYTYFDDNHNKQNWEDLTINSIDSYKNDGSVYMGSSGEGVLRMSYSAIDGFTGASALRKWSNNLPDTVFSVSIYDTIQWYGTSGGAYQHLGPSTKNYWDFTLTTNDGVINPVVKDIEKDDLGNIWIGTEKGINIITADGILKYASGIQSSDIIAYPSMFQATLTWTNGNGFAGSMLNEKINDIQKDFEGKVWIASDSGVEFYQSVPGVPYDEDAKRVVFVTKSVSSTIEPQNGTTYVGNSEYKKGTAVGSWYCVYNGNENSVDVSGLSANSVYKVAVFDYYGEPGHEVYSKIEGANNPITFTTSAVGNESVSNKVTRVFPIPFNEYLVIHLNSEPNKSFSATISNLDGKVFKKLTIEKNNQRIETSELPKGVYIFKITDGANEKIMKIIK